MRTTPVSLLPGLLLTAALALPAHADFNAALDRAPADSELILIIPDPAAYSDALQDMLQQWNVPDTDDMPTLLEAMIDDFGVDREHIDINAPFILALADLETAAETGDDPDVTSFIPVTDYDALIQSLGGDPGDEIASITVDNEPLFARHHDGYAVMSDNQELVEAYEPGGQAEVLRGRIGEPGQQALEHAHAALYIDIPAVANAMLVGLQQHGEELADEFGQGVEQGMGPGDPLADDLDQFVEPALESLEAALELIALEGDGALLSHSISDTGTGIDLAASFHEFGHIMQHSPGNGEDLSDILASIPERPFLWSAALDTRTISFDRITEIILDELIPEDDPLGIQTFFAETPEILAHTEQMAIAYYAPEIMLMGGGDLIDLVSVSTSADPEALRHANQRQIEAMDGQSLPGFDDLFADPFDDPFADVDALNGADPAAGQGVTIRTTYETDAFEINGVSVDQYTVEYEIEAMNDPAMMEMAMFTEMLNYGGYVAVQNDHVLTTTTDDIGTLQDVLRAIDEHDGIGTGPAFAEQFLDEAVVDDAGMVAYFSFHGLASTANSFLGMMGIQIDIPEDTPPFTFSVGSDSQTLSFRAYTAHDTIRNVSDAFQAFDDMDPMMGPPMEPGPFDEPQQPGGPPPF